MLAHRIARGAGVLMLIFGASSAVTAQNPPMDPPDSITERARREGAAAADRPSVAGYLASGFVSGVLTGYMLPITLREGDSGSLGDPETQLLVIGVGGIVISLAGARWSGATPQPGNVPGRANGADYAQAYQEGFARRLRQRRQRAVLLGGAAGLAAGFGLLYLVATNTN